MESIGQHLRQARESRGLSIEQVVRDTNISKHYIVGLEEDKHEVFPAEPYVIGFLRNYSDHLGLDTENLISQYRTLKIQEQPAPLTELIRQPSPWPQRIMVWGGVALVTAVVLVFLIPAVFDFVSNLPKTIASAVPAKQNKEFSLPADKKDLTQRLFPGDTVSVLLGDKTYRFQAKAINSDVTLNTENGEYKMKLGDEIFVDLDGNSQQDLRLFLKDLTPGDPGKGAELTFERLTKTNSLAEGTPQLGNELKPEMVVDGGSASGSAPTQKAIAILEDTQAKPFTLDVVFRGNALFRYVVDDNMREENYFRKGETVRIEASKRVKLWVSNSAAFAGKINSQTDFEIGHGGEIAARVIEWTKDASGKIVLSADPLD